MQKQQLVKRIAWIAVGGAAVLAFFSFAVMLLWNNILVPVLRVTAIGFWQAAGLLVLSKILFGGFGRGPWRRNGGQCRGGEGWKEKMRSRWEQLTPEERAQLKQRWKDRCRRRGPGAEQEAGNQ